MRYTDITYQYCKNLPKYCLVSSLKICIHTEYFDVRKLTCLVIYGRVVFISRMQILRVEAASDFKQLALNRSAGNLLFVEMNVICKI